MLNVIIVKLTKFLNLLFLQLFIIDKTIGLRISLQEEIQGADWCEHGIPSKSIHKGTAALGRHASQKSNRADSFKGVDLHVRGASFNRGLNMAEDDGKEIVLENTSLEERSEGNSESASQAKNNMSTSEANDKTENEDSRRCCRCCPNCIKETKIETVDRRVSVKHSTVRVTEH